MSSTEAEYMALSEATREATYMQRFLTDLEFGEFAGVRMFCDNNGVRRLAENPVFHKRSKHIAVRHHYVREVLASGKLKLEYTPTEDMAADVLTKGVHAQRHKKCMELLGVTSVRPQA